MKTKRSESDQKREVPPESSRDRYVARRDAIGNLSDEEYEKHVAAQLARFGDKAGQHGALNGVQVLIPVRVSRDIGLDAQSLAKRLGLRRATWAAQGLAVLAKCHPDDWFKAIAAFQSAQKRRATSELT